MSGRVPSGCLSLPQKRALRDAAAGALGKDPLSWFCIGGGGRRYCGRTVYSLFSRDLVAPGEGRTNGRQRVEITAKGLDLLTGQEGSAA